MPLGGGTSCHRTPCCLLPLAAVFSPTCPSSRTPCLLYYHHHHHYYYYCCCCYGCYYCHCLIFITSAPKSQSHAVKPPRARCCKNTEQKDADFHPPSTRPDNKAALLKKCKTPGSKSSCIYVYDKRQMVEDEEAVGNPFKQCCCCSCVGRPHPMLPHASLLQPRSKEGKGDSAPGSPIAALQLCMESLSKATGSG